MARGPGRSRGACPFVRGAVVAATLVAALGAARCTNSTLATIEPSPLKCDIGLTPEAVSIGTSSVLVSFAVAAATECEWTPASTSGWISQITPAWGQGAGIVRFRAAANNGPARTGTLTVAGAAFTVTQASGCSYAIAPTSRAFGGGGGSAMVTVTTASACPWTAQVADNARSWLAITTGSSGSGSGTVDIVVAPLFFGSRTGTITIAGRTFTVVQSV